MISPDARLRLERIPIASLQVKGEYEEPMSLERVQFYYQKLRDHPSMYVGVLSVVPSDTHPKSYCILDGRHKFLASILADRRDALCIVEEGAA